MKKDKIKTFILLNILLMIYSMSGIFSKKAAQTKTLSIKFCIFYGCVILILGIYAIGWQQVIKRLPLTTAFANKAVTVVWGIIWGMIFFSEHITVGKVVGALFVIGGVIIFAYSDTQTDEHGDTQNDIETDLKTEGQQNE